MTARIGAPKTGGRVKGKSLDRGERQLVTNKMAADIMSVYAKLGGVKWLLKFAEDNPVEFLRQGLSKFFPAAPKDDEVGGTYNQFNFNSQDTLEAARRVAFAMNAGIAAQRELAPVAEQEAYEVPRWRAPDDMPGMLPPEPIDNPAQAEWAASLPLTPEERRNQALVRNTREATIENYAGSPGEQGGSIRSPSSVERDPRAAQRDRMLARRRKLL
jgi:hypothetical protein